MMLTHLACNNLGTYRKAKLNGRDHFVVPVSMIVPGVLNGSKGALYYSASEIAKNYDAWNGMPLVVYHPIRNGQPVSARHPEVLNSQSVGVVLKSRINTNGKLIAEGWFDVKKTKKVDERVYNALAKGEKIELSTGLFTENVPVTGATFNGKPYTHEAINYRPDHLAVLPDQTGACSIKDGCGVGVHNSKAPVTTNQMNHEELRSELEKALRARYMSGYLVDIYPDHVIYRLNERYLKMGYTVSKKTDTVEIDSISPPVEVRRMMDYRPVVNQDKLDDARQVINVFSDEARKAALEARKRAGGAVKAAGQAVKHAGKDIIKGLVDKLKSRLGMKSKPAAAKPKPSAKPAPKKATRSGLAAKRKAQRESRLSKYKQEREDRKKKAATKKTVRSKVRAGRKNAIATKAKQSRAKSVVARSGSKKSSKTVAMKSKPKEARQRSRA